MIVIPWIPGITFWVNYFTEVKGGRYKVYNETYVVRHLIFNVWYNAGNMKSYKLASRFVRIANSLK